MLLDGSSGSSRAQRLDSTALPLRFETSDAAADGATREVELHRERVVLRRSPAGMRMELNMLLTDFRSAISFRRAVGRMSDAPPVYRGEREIFARN
jgi:hypothetical protein